MKHYEEFYLTYRGFREGEYIHRYYLTETLRSELSTREALLVYHILRCFNFSTLGSEMLPSKLRWVSSQLTISKQADLLQGEELVIHYTHEKLMRIIPKEHVAALVSACCAYIRELEDVHLSDTELDALICLNERLQLFQDTVAAKMLEKSSGAENAGILPFSIEYSFELSEKDTEYREMNHNVLFRFDESFKVGDTEFHQRRGKDWNKKRDVHECRLYQVPHCCLFRQLEHYSAMPLKHLLKVGRVNARLSTATELSFLTA